MRANLISILLVLTAVSAGCAQVGEGRFTVGAVHRHAECMATAFPFEPIFLASRERAKSLGIFLQSRGGSFQFVDVVYFEVFDPATIEVGVAYPMDPITTPDSRVVSGVELGESCPDIEDSLSLEGELVLDSFSREVDGIVAGSVEDARLVDLRSGELVADGFTGSFEFPVQVGQPYEEFRN